MKSNIKKFLGAASLYALALTSCNTVGNNINTQKGSDKDISIKNKLVFEASLAYDKAAKASDAALAAFNDARAKARTAAPEDRATAMAAIDAAEAELEAKSDAAEAASGAVMAAHAEARAAYEAAYPEEAKARATALAPVLAAAGNSLDARAHVYGKFALENRTKTATSRAFARDYIQYLGNAGSISVNPSDPKVAKVANTEKTPTKAVAGRDTRPQTDSDGNKTHLDRTANRIERVNHR